MTSLLSQNSKIAKSKKRTFNFGIPAFRSESGFKTCPFAGACALPCYAKQGAYAWPIVKRAYEWRLGQTKSPEFVNRMVTEIIRRRAQRIRVHDSGDFYSLTYMRKWIEIANRMPEVEFYAYTKAIAWSKMIDWPRNWTLIFSYGGKEDYLIDSNDRHSRVFTDRRELRKLGYADSSKNDDVAVGNNPKIGLVYHGAKNRERSLG